MIIHDKITKERFECFLIDNGTLDIEISIYNILGNDNYNMIFNSEYASQYRNKRGILSLKGFKKLVLETIELYYESKM